MAVALPNDPGTYALLLALGRPARLEVGRLGRLDFPAGWYLYVGSAFGPGGLAARLGRHLEGRGRPRWHIDRLRAVARPGEAWFSADPRRREADWATVAEGLAGASPVAGFGATDSRASSHLWHFDAPPSFAAFARRVHRACPGHAPLRRLRLPLGGRRD